MCTTVTQATAPLAQHTIIQLQNLNTKDGGPETFAPSYLHAMKRCKHDFVRTSLPSRNSKKVTIEQIVTPIGDKACPGKEGSSKHPLAEKKAPTFEASSQDEVFDMMMVKHLDDWLLIS